MHIFGSKVLAHIPKEKSSKLDEKEKELTFVGYSETSKGLRSLDTKTNKITISRNFVFQNITEDKINLNEKIIKVKTNGVYIQISHNNSMDDEAGAE